MENLKIFINLMKNEEISEVIIVDKEGEGI